MNIDELDENADNPRRVAITRVVGLYNSGGVAIIRGGGLSNGQSVQIDANTRKFVEL